MIVEEEKKEEIKRNHSKFVPRLSGEEKDIIERISGLTGYKFNTVREVLLALSVMYTIDFKPNQEVELNIPYLFKVKVRIEKDHKKPGKEKLISLFNTEAAPAFNNILEKLESNQETWLTDYFKTNIRNFVSKTLDIKEDEQ